MRTRRLSLVFIAILAIGLVSVGCGGDDGDETTAHEAASGDAQDAQNLDRFLMQEDEEPGFRPGAAPGALPRSRDTITGVEAFVKEMQLTPTDASRLRSEGFISTTVQPIRGPQAAGISGVTLFATAGGAKQDMAHELQRDVIRAFGPVEDLQYFAVSGIPGARGWTASEPHVGNVFWIEGRCVLVLGNQGPGPFAGPLSIGARAIYQRTHGECP